MVFRMIRRLVALFDKRLYSHGSLSVFFFWVRTFEQTDLRLRGRMGGTD